VKVDAVKLGAFLVFVAIALGAFGAHVLKNLLDAHSLDIFETAVRYQLYDGLGLLAIAGLKRNLDRAKLLIFIGAVVFSGSLYLLAFSGIAISGAITPIGGVIQLTAWALLFFSTKD